MDLKLTIDRGNTAIKAALWKPDGSIIAATKGDESLPAGDVAAQICSLENLPLSAVKAGRILHCGEKRQVGRPRVAP